MNNNPPIITKLINLNKNSQNDADALKILIDQGNVNERGLRDMTPLHWAVKRGLSDGAASYLIDKGANINAQNVDGNTPLHLAAMLEIDRIELTLLEYNADVNIRNKWGKTPADILRIKSYGMRRMPHILRPGTVERSRNIRQMSRRLIPDPPLDIPVVSRRIIPSIKNNLRISKENAVPNNECSICIGEFQSDDPVCLANCRHSYHCNCINDWLGTGKNSCPECRTNITSLIQLNDTQAGQLKSSRSNSFGDNKLGKLVSMKRYLGSLGDNNNNKNKNNKNRKSSFGEDNTKRVDVVITKNKKRNINTIKKSIREGVDVNGRLPDGDTPLCFAIKNKEYSIARLLLQNGADPNMKDQYTNSPIGLALLLLSPKFVKLLLKYGADPTVIESYKKESAVESYRKTLEKFPPKIKSTKKYKKLVDQINKLISKY